MDKRYALVRIGLVATFTWTLATQGGCAAFDLVVNSALLVANVANIAVAATHPARRAPACEPCLDDLDLPRPPPPPRPVDPSAEAQLQQAEAALSDGQWQAALVLAQAPRVRFSTPGRAWRVIGAAACQLGDRERVELALQQLQGEARRDLAVLRQRTRDCSAITP